MKLKKKGRPLGKKIIREKSDFDKLNIKQQKFIENYLTNGFNASKAYVDAGYATKHSDINGSRLLNSDSISHIIRQKRIEMRQASDKLILLEISTRAELQRERDRIARANVAKLFDDRGNLKPLNQIDEDMQCAIASVEIKETSTDSETGITTQVKKITMCNKITAIDRLDEYLEKREREIAEDGSIPKDASIIENGLQITTNYDQEMPNPDLQEIIDNG